MTKQMQTTARTKKLICGLFACWALTAAGIAAAESDADRIQQLEQTVLELQKQVQQLLQQVPASEASASRLTESDVVTLKAAAERFNQPEAQRLLAADSWIQKFTLGGYGEMHASFNQGSEEDQFDIHRLVLYIGYDFSDWIKFHSEIEVEHAFVSDGKGGYLVIEQAHIDFLLSQSFNLRLGRVLTPLGIINQLHEPATFNGVERPAFSKHILPSTWSSDGIGVFGEITEQLSYEAYVVNGLDGSKLSADDGLRGGRMHERPGLNEPAVTGRVDYRPVSTLRLGVSGYLGGINNGNKGKNPGVDGHVRILSADFDWSIYDFDFRGAIAHNRISDASGLPTGVAEEMLGWYLEGAYHFWPEAFKRGKLKRSDAVAFVRYDSYDTQYKMPSGVAADERYDRNDLTVGLSFKPVPNFVLKADYQFREHEADDTRGNALNLGVGWNF